MSVVGEGLREYVSNQINTRQTVYGSLNRTNEQLEYLNSRTAFVKLISSVDIEDPAAFQRNNSDSDIYSIVNSNSGASLAKKFVLFNGTANESTDVPRAGISRNPNSLINNTAYGLGGLTFGARPMPGITSVDVKNENRGSLKTGTIKIKAWNRTQFEVVDLLYLRLGFTVLLEWGNNIFYNNSGVFQSNNPYSLADEFLAGNYTPSSILEAISNTRKNSEGNYDALYGKVVNFEWSFAEDGSYDITLTIRSIGDVVESLTINNLVNDTEEEAAGELPEGEEEETDIEEPTIESYKDKHQLGKLFYEAKQAFSRATGNYNFANGSCYAYTNLFSGIKEVTGKKHFISQTYLEGEKQYYIRFGSLLAFLEKRVIPLYVKKSDPLIKIDFDTDRNIIYFNPLQVSTDPRVCLINNSVKTTQSVYYFASQGESYTKAVGTSTVGQVMNVYLNFMYLNKTLDANTNSNNKVAIIDFLKAVCDDISRSLGSINTLEPFIDEETNTLTIIDQTPLPNKDAILDSLGLRKQSQQTSIDLYGYYNRGGVSKAGFVRNFGIKTELNSSFASTITIGAQAAGSVVGEDATALSSLNKGLKDRTTVGVEDNNPPTKDENKDTPQSKIAELRQRFPNANKNYTAFLSTIGSQNDATTPTWNADEIDSYNVLLTNFLGYLQGRSAILSKGKKSSGNIGFIPISLNLTLDGLSGIKIYNSIKVDTSYLPSNYPETMDFIITGVGHKIESNVWTTDLTTIMVPNNVIDGEGAEMEDNPVPNQGSGKSGGGGTPPANGEGSDALSERDASRVDGQDAALTINPNKVGASSYKESPVAKLLTSQGYVNGLLPANDPVALVSTNTKGANTTYNPDGFHRLHPSANAAWQAFKAELDSKEISYRISSAYRSQAHQKSLGTGSTVASPGSSPHGWGGALDFGNLYGVVKGSGNAKINKEARVTSQAYFDIASIGAKYGWYNPWRLADSSGTDEIWHFEYWGPVDPTFGPTQEESNANSERAFYDLAVDLKNIYELKDKFGANGTKLFAPFKGLNDNERGAIEALNKFIQTPNTQKLINQLTDETKKLFTQLFASLKAATLAKNVDEIKFKTAKGTTTITINPDF